MLAAPLAGLDLPLKVLVWEDGKGAVAVSYKRLLDAVRRAAGATPVLTIVIGDHGESLGEHGEATHGVLAYDSTLHVPLIVAGSGFPTGVRSQPIARTADITPTILAAAGASSVREGRGKPLTDRLKGANEEETADYFECFGPHYEMGWARLAGVRTGRWKYTAEPKPAELYDLRTDPDETVNRASGEPAVVERLETAYARLSVPAVHAEAGSSMSLALAEKLAALGYMTAPQHFPTGQEPDPRAVVQTIALVEQARRLAAAGRVADSIEALQILAKSPVLQAQARHSLGALYLAAARYEDAVKAYEELLVLTGTPAARAGLARAQLAAQRGLLEQPSFRRSRGFEQLTLVCYS